MTTLSQVSDRFHFSQLSHVLLPTGAEKHPESGCPRWSTRSGATVSHYAVPEKTETPLSATKEVERLERGKVNFSGKKGKRSRSYSTPQA